MRWIIPPFNGRILALLLVWLFLLDWGLNVFLDRQILDQQVWRIDNPDMGSLQAVFDRIEQAPGIVVVALGDSAMYGSSTPPQETIPAYLAKTLRQQYPGQTITMFNLGIKGLKPAEAYFIARRLARLPVDILIYSVNTGWFTSTEGVTFPAVVQLAGAEQEAARRGIKVAPVTWENRLDNGVARYWDFYRYRRVVARQFRDMFKDRGQERLALNWRQKPELLPKGAKADLGPLYLHENNLQWQMYLAMAAEWQQTGRPAVFFLNPANWELVKKKYNLDYAKLRAEQQKVIAKTRERAVPSLDFTHLVDERWFTDEVHLQAPGNRLVAEKLAQALADWPGSRAILTAGGRQ